MLCVSRAFLKTAVLIVLKVDSRSSEGKPLRSEARNPGTSWAVGTWELKWGEEYCSTWNGGNAVYVMVLSPSPDRRGIQQAAAGCWPTKAHHTKNSHTRNKNEEGNRATYELLKKNRGGAHSFYFRALPNHLW